MVVLRFSESKVQHLRKKTIIECPGAVLGFAGLGIPVLSEHQNKWSSEPGTKLIQQTLCGQFLDILQEWTVTKRMISVH